jgi:hypothetical protein
MKDLHNNIEVYLYEGLSPVDVKLLFNNLDNFIFQTIAYT